MILIILISVNILYGNINAYINYNCSNNGTIKLNLNDVAFFETPNFPKYCTPDELQSCNATFVFNDPVVKNPRLFSLQYEWTKDLAWKGFTYTISRNLSYSMLNHFVSFIPDADLSQQGYLIFDKGYDNCPLESISRPFSFENENQILHILSNFYTYSSRNYSCFWEFTAPKGYGFKVIIYKFDVTNGTKFRIKNTTDLILNEGNIKINYPYYNSDQYIQISLTKGDPNIITTDMELQGYISIVKNTREKISVTCIAVEQADAIYWNSPESGFGNNMHCQYSLSLPPNNLVVITPNIFTEYWTDIIQYTIDQNPIKTIMPGPIQYFIPSDKTKTRNVLFEYISDGSFKSAGFSVELELVPCQCRSSAIPCDGSRYNLLNITSVQFDTKDLYCNNLTCEFALKQCSTPLSMFEFVPHSYDLRSQLDVFKIISKEQIIFELNFGNIYKRNAFVFLNSSNEYVFEAISNPTDLSFTRFSVDLKEVKTPTFNNIVLSKNESTAIIDTYATPFISVETLEISDSKNATFKLYCMNPNYLDIHDNKNALSISGKDDCFSNFSKYKCNVYSNKISVFYYEKENHNTFMAVRLTKPPKSCILGENIFVITELYATVAALSSKNEECLLSILINNGNREDTQDFGYQIIHMFTTATKENIQIFVGIDQKELFFEFNSKTSKLWKNIWLFSQIYTIKIPKAASVFLIFKKYQITLGNPVLYITIDEYPYRSILSTPNYGYAGVHGTLYNGEFIIFEIRNFPVSFTVLNSFKYGLGNIFFQDENDRKKFYPNKTGDILVFQNQKIWIFLPSVKLADSYSFLVQSFSDKGTSRYDVIFWQHANECCRPSEAL